MYLKELKLTNFKNCESADMQFSEKINCFVGLNGAGKTNILDAIYYLAFCKSYFTTTDKQNIRHGEDFFAIHGDFVTDNEETQTISCVQKVNCSNLVDHRNCVFAIIELFNLAHHHVTCWV